MNNQDQARRKYISGTATTNYKNVLPNNPNNIPLINKQWKRSDVSRQKQDKKLTIDRPTLKLNNLTNHINHINNQMPLSTVAQDNNKANPKNINFKNLKQTVPKKQQAQNSNHPHPKNLIHPVIPLQPVHKPSTVQYYTSSTTNANNNKNVRNNNNNQQQQQPQHGISINVNIQNMISQKQIQNMNLEQQGGLSDRSGIADDKKNKKIVGNNNNVGNTNNIGNASNNSNKIDDFECKQQLVFKRPTQTQKQNKFQDKTVQKRPLLPHKHKLQTNQQLKLAPLKPIDIKQQLKKFQQQIQSINSAAQTQSITYLDYRQQMYLIPPHYIQKNQKNYNWKMRVTLFQWMMQVSYQFSLKRQTFYISVNLVDLFLSKEWNLQRADFQLAGTAAMFIASKLQEFQPKCSDQFAKATKRYSALQVKQMQKRICKALKYTLNPPTFSTWANRFMLQWDSFLEQQPSAQRHPLFATCQQKFFKKYDKDSYWRYRAVMQFLDCATLDIQTVQYQPKLLVCAFMYLVLGNSMGIFKQDQIWMQFPRSSLYLLDQDNLFNDLFMNFLQTSFNIMLIDLLPTVQYCATYYGLTLNFDQPITPVGSDLENIDFQDYCSYQTYNPAAKSYVFNTRFRGMYE